MLFIRDESGNLIAKVVTMEVMLNSVKIHYFDDNNELTSSEYANCFGDVKLAGKIR